MARLPRYRPLGAQIPSLPQVDYAGTARAQARVADTISKQLDRMASVAFREAELQAKIEGAEYGATNAPTAKELLDAQSDEQREALTPGGTGTVYDRAAREAALRVIGTNLETAARNEIAAVRANAKVDFTPLDQVQNEIDGIINGYTGALYDIAPAAAPTLRGTLSSVGNSAAMAHANIMADKVKADAEFNAIQGMQTIVDGIQQRVATAAAAGADEIVALVTTERNNILTLADLVDDKTAYVSMTNNFDNNVDAALVGIVSDWVMEDPIKHAKQLRTNAIENTAVKNVVGLMDDEQRRTAVKAANDAINGYYSRLSQEDAAAGRQRDARVRELTDGLATMIRMGEVDGAQSLINELSEYDAAKAQTYFDAFFVQGGIDDAVTITRLNQAALNGRLTEDMVIAAVGNRKVTRTTAGTLLSRVESQRNEDHNAAMKLVRNAFGIPEFGLVELNPRGKRADAHRIVGDAESQLIMASRADPGMDKIAWAEAFIKKGNHIQLLKQEMKEAQGIVNQIAKDSLGLSGTADRDVIRSGSQSRLMTVPGYQDDHMRLLEALIVIQRNEELLAKMENNQ